MARPKRGDSRWLFPEDDIHGRLGAGTNGMGLDRDREREEEDALLLLPDSWRKASAVEDDDLFNKAYQSINDEMATCTAWPATPLSTGAPALSDFGHLLRPLLRGAPLWAGGTGETPVRVRGQAMKADGAAVSAGNKRRKTSKEPSLD